MSSISNNLTLIVTDMTCAHCEIAIEQALKKERGIIHVVAKYSTGKVKITYEKGEISLDKIKNVIENAGYHVKKEQPVFESDKAKKGVTSTTATVSKGKDYSDLVGIIVIIFAIYVTAKHLGLLNILNQFPVAKEGMGYGVLFVIGLLTSLHCVGMCGGICISQCVNQNDNNPTLSKWSPLRPSLLYNLGRVISYTVIGGIVGEIGKVVSFSGTMKGIVQILAGVFMVIMGINLLGVFPGLRKLNPRMPKIFANKLYLDRNNKSPLYIGILNGFMPCGPLQAMQLYALSTGSPLKGALSMFLFSIGTVPLMFGIGAISSFLNKKFTEKMMKVSAVLVIVMGLFMFNYGASLSGIVLPGSGISSGSVNTNNIAKEEDGIQVITTGLSSGRYEPIVVKKGIPVKWIIQAKDGEINGCNNAIVIPKLGKRVKLEAGDNVIEFTPTQAGVIPFSCWMGMIRSKITVVDDLPKGEAGVIPSDIPNLAPDEYEDEEGLPGGCCG